MKLTVINGSPRGKRSNTRILLDHFLRGYLTVCESDFRMLYLKEDKSLDEYAEHFKNSDIVILAFPLYCDSMPAIVKRFIEKLQAFEYKDDAPILGFIVQSGFPETIHSRYVEKYLVKLAERLNCHYAGTVIKGGVEGIQIKPSYMTRKLFRNFHLLGVYFARHDQFDPRLIKKIAGRDKMTMVQLWGLRLGSLFALPDFYWNYQLKKNNVRHLRDRQYYGCD